MSQASDWDAALAAFASPPPLLQSWAWGEVQSRAGWAVERVRLDGAMASVLTRGLGPLREAYVPRGPVPATPASVASLLDWARERRLARLRIEPEAPPQLGEGLKSLGFAVTTPIQPQHSVVVRLRAPDEMLKGFRHGRRYNIRAGLRRGALVEEGRDAAELARQSAAVERRASIDLPERGYYQLLLELLPWCRTFVARHPESGDALAAVLVARHAGRGYSLFAGRSGDHPELMGNDLAWWAALTACAQAGDSDFDLWGTPPPGAAPDHPWRGLGLFKSEFNGEEVAYAGAWEVELSRGGSKLLGLGRSTRPAIRRLRRNIS
ncbi:MAG TPA: GNAT family N-acetyltransferase [Candidatus Dormibacteraeota bacterium]|nr:GNAT family N-acetyltransferase [Candidatus Dormibacteraeota bacterium]